MRGRGVYGAVVLGWSSGGGPCGGGGVGPDPGVSP